MRSLSSPGVYLGCSLRPSYSNIRPYCSSSTRSVPRHVPPLRILFCGSDEFSTASLKHLHTAHKEDASFIQSIDVVCKQGKPSGRGLKNTRDVPIKNVAQELGLTIHEIPTFTGWSPPQYGEESISLVVAVSFGLLVPPRILNIATYGGLNVHPSLLPALRGPAPLQHTLLHDIRKTGITLQTLHPKKFDHGHIIAQDAFDLPDDSQSSFPDFRDYMGERGAKLLVSTLRTGAFVPPYAPVQNRVMTTVSDAPKLTKEDAHIDWQKWSSDYILRAQKAMGTLWSIWKYDVIDKTSGELERRSLRVQWHDFSIQQNDITEKSAGVKPGIPLIQEHLGAILSSDGKLLSPGSVTIEGRKKGWPGSSRKIMQYLLDIPGKPHGTGGSMPAGGSMSAGELL